MITPCRFPRARPDGASQNLHDSVTQDGVLGYASAARWAERTIITFDLLM